MALFVLLAFILVVPFGLYLLNERGRGLAWGLVPDGEQVRGAGAYRETRVRLWKRGSAPTAVRVAAFSSFFLGQMVVPGGLAALVGFLITAGSMMSGKTSPVLAVLTLSSPTGLVVAVHLLAAGNSMLSRAADAAARARTAARWALTHNVVLLTALGIAVLAVPAEAEYAALPALYCMFSLAQALLVRHAGRAIDGYVALQDSNPAPVEAELRVLGDAG